MYLSQGKEETSLRSAPVLSSAGTTAVHWITSPEPPGDPAERSLPLSATWGSALSDMYDCSKISPGHKETSLLWACSSVVCDRDEEQGCFGPVPALSVTETRSKVALDLFQRCLCQRRGARLLWTCSSVVCDRDEEQGCFGPVPALSVTETRSKVALDLFQRCLVVCDRDEEQGCFGPVPALSVTETRSKVALDLFQRCLVVCDRDEEQGCFGPVPALSVTETRSKVALDLFQRCLVVCDRDEEQGCFGPVPALSVTETRSKVALDLFQRCLCQRRGARLLWTCSSAACDIKTRNKSTPDLLQRKFDPEAAMLNIKQELVDDSYVPAVSSGHRTQGSMQKVPSLSDLSDQESSLEEVYPHLPRDRVEDSFVKPTLSTSDRDSNSDLPVIGSLVQHESDALDHAAIRWKGDRVGYDAPHRLSFRFYLNIERDIASRSYLEFDTKPSFSFTFENIGRKRDKSKKGSKFIPREGGVYFNQGERSVAGDRSTDRHGDQQNDISDTLAQSEACLSTELRVLGLFPGMSIHYFHYPKVALRSISLGTPALNHAATEAEGRHVNNRVRARGGSAAANEDVEYYSIKLAACSARTCELSNRGSRPLYPLCVVTSVTIVPSVVVMAAQKDWMFAFHSEDVPNTTPATALLSEFENSCTNRQESAIPSSKPISSYKAVFKLRSYPESKNICVKGIALYTLPARNAHDGEP
uniref:Uncharacterized protein n=2 Tax=Timema bartmani TaxID=61472 RepID=A0A7R9HZ29_9NEOP|nr:unnamed protein product [Timema bartmani]